ncbi:MAG: class I SAM-dependent methyltransferase [Planctomycetales bacterium]|nr:class I SAM-dependent methyltransferase [Planctomycetales bacterium]
MSIDEQVIRRLEDFILAERKLQGITNVPFQHHGKDVSGYAYVRAMNKPLVAALSELSPMLSHADRKLRFLEVGSGIGTKCQLAQLLGYAATGIDLLPEYVELAQHIYIDCDFQHANALAYNYEPFDVVYYHVPFFDDELIEQLENRVLSQVHTGGILIATRISPALTRFLDADPVPHRDYAAHRLRLGQDIGRLVVVRKTVPRTQA